MRVIADNGDMLGVMPTGEALRRAQERGLDLVEVNPKAEPPVCKILDFGKFKYDEKKKAREAKRKQSVVEIKEIKLRPKTDDHDLAFKTRAAHRFLEAGHKVKFTVRFRGREITHPEKAQEQLDWIVKECEEIANIEVRPAMEQRTMTLLMAPKPAIMQKGRPSPRGFRKGPSEGPPRRSRGSGRGHERGGRAREARAGARGSRRGRRRRRGRRGRCGSRWSRWSRWPGRNLT